MNEQQAKKQWDGMTPEARLALIRKDPSMRRREWQSLATRWAASKWDDLTNVTKSATAELLGQ